MNLLDPTQLHALTGYRNGSRQAKWVRDNLGLEPLIGADGRPRLTEAMVEQAALQRRCGQTSAQAGVSSSPQPNWRKAA